MTTRRDFFRLAAQTATATTLAGNQRVDAEQNEGLTITRRRGRPLLDLQQRFVDLRFGMFVHFNLATFQDREWGDPTAAAEAFHPTALDTDQWAAAARSANMTWGCLTTRHHDGFCLWPTRTQAASVAQTSHRTDVVRAYLDSFRKAGLRVGLYYSILSLRDDIRHFNITPAKVKLIKVHLSELFSGYGEVDILITDGWNAPWSRITYEEVHLADGKRPPETAARAFCRRWRQEYPSMVRQLERDLPDLLAFFRFPRRLWRKLRTTNIIERCFVDVRRRTRPMVCFVNVQSVDRIIYPILQRFNLEWKNRTLRLFTQAA